jgi:hypothetical protein
MNDFFLIEDEQRKDKARQTGTTRTVQTPNANDNKKFPEQH